MDLVIFGIYQKINKCNLGTNCTLRSSFCLYFGKPLPFTFVLLYESTFVRELSTKFNHMSLKQNAPQLIKLDLDKTQQICILICHQEAAQPSDPICFHLLSFDF